MNPATNNEPSRDDRHVTEILLVEDNPGDVLLTREALNGTQVPHVLRVVNDGEQAMAFLRRLNGHADAPRPDLILLDLNLPRKSGHEVIAEVKANPNLKSIPIVVLSSSESDQDVARAYKLNVNCYLTKRPDFLEFLQTMQAFQEFWLNTVKLPPR